MGTRLDFGHMVIDEKGCIFASARDGSGKIHNFYINGEEVSEQQVKGFGSVTESWADYVKQCIKQTRDIPTFRIDSIVVS
jgi:ribosomal protein L16 Arg81 hydroxylase